RPVVVDDEAVARPRAERRREAAVRDEVDLPHVRHLADRIHEVVHHRPAADREERLRTVLRQGPQPRRVPRGEDDRVHAAVTAASETSYGARWTPSSVTIVVTSAAGVTSKAGFRAGKRSVTSA